MGSVLRALASMVAVLLVASVLLGGWAWRDWESHNVHPQPGPNLNRDLIANLEARPFNLHVVPSSAACPTGPYGAYAGYGDGPVSLLGGLPRHTRWGNYFDGLAYTSPGLTGPVVGRGLDLKTGRAIVFIGSRAIGRVTGTDTVGGAPVQQRAAILLDTDHPPRALNHEGEFYVWGVPVGVPAGASGCTGFQFDGLDFSESFAVSGSWAGLNFYWPPDAVSG